jgi:hypothetical protein
MYELMAYYKSTLLLQRQTFDRRTSFNVYSMLVFRRLSLECFLCMPVNTSE